MPFPSRSEYERLVYGLIDFFPDVGVSSLRLYSTSALTAIVEGEITLRNGLLIQILEVLDFKAGRIRNYSYAVYHNGLKIRWYDPQPHPENQALASTFPHHFHEEPDIKHNRLPATGISFEQPNLPTLIVDCMQLK